jgi:hypothetical protein
MPARQGPDHRCASSGARQHPLEVLTIGQVLRDDGEALGDGSGRQSDMAAINRLFDSLIERTILHGTSSDGIRTSSPSFCLSRNDPTAKGLHADDQLMWRW